MYRSLQSPLDYDVYAPQPYPPDFYPPPVYHPEPPRLYQSTQSSPMNHYFAQSSTIQDSLQLEKYIYDLMQQDRDMENKRLRS